MCRSLELASNDEGETRITIATEPCEKDGHDTGRVELAYILDPAEAVDIAMGLFQVAAPFVQRKIVRENEASS